MAYERFLLGKVDKLANGGLSYQLLRCLPEEEKSNVRDLSSALKFISHIGMQYISICVLYITETDMRCHRCRLGIHIR